jgi:formiminotetrahydrofolate cyclodeaminase
LFIVNTIDRFIDCGNVIDSAMESDMRDNQQYLIGERIDGAFGFIRSYVGSIIGAATGLFIPWVYKSKGFDGQDYSVLDVYVNYNEKLPLSQQIKNPNCVLFSLMDTLLTVSVIGAAIDVLPWFAYDITETGQKSMIRVVRIRTLIEDYSLKTSDDSTYIEGCEAIINARKFYGLEKQEKPDKAVLKRAKAMPSRTKEEKDSRHLAIKAARQQAEDVRQFNENIEIAEFVMHELTRFENEFGQKQLQLCSLIVSAGPQHFFEYSDEAIKLAVELPLTNIREERTWRKQEIRNARALIKSKTIASRWYPEGIVEFDPQAYEDAYNMPDETRQEAKLRRIAMRKANKEKNLYATVASPYLAAVRTLELAKGYADLEGIISDYDEIIRKRDERHDKERMEFERIAQEREIDKQRKNSQRKMGRG